MKQFLLLAVALLGHVWSQPCAPQANEWMSPLNLQGPHYEPSFKPLHIFAFLDGGEGLILENTGDTVSVTYPIRPNIQSTPPNLTDIQISKGPLADKYTADHLEFRWGPAVLPAAPSSSTGGAASATGGATGGATSSSSSTGTFLLETAEAARARVEWGSDHGFSGHYFPLEMQVFFYNTKYKSYAEALAASPQEPDFHDVNEDVVALSVLFEVGDQNEELVKITDRLELIRVNGSSTNIPAKMCFEKIVGKARDFITYPGSLTRAPCTRGVRWIVLVETLTVSQSQLDQFRLITLDSPDWLPPLDQDLNHRVVQTNLKELPPIFDDYIPAFHPHGPPLNVLSPDVDGTVINPYAKDATDAAYKNYWSPFDYTIVDDAEPASATGGSTTELASTADVTPTGGATGTTGGATGGGSPTGGVTPTGGTGVTAFLLEATGGTTPGGGGTGGGGGEDTGTTGGTGGVLPGPTGGVVSSTNAPQTDDHHVDIPNFFHLSTVAYFTPDFAPKKHSHDEENHFHPPSADVDSPTMPDDDSSSFKGKKGQHSLNPAPQPAAKAFPQMKQKTKTQATVTQKVAAAKAQAAKKPVNPKNAFLNGKRANKK